ncbi:MAG: exodeoxyribonuclease V subunit gamma [Burkholderiaceae bacterium]|nr:exodeoxyribonuclease V subunit gamma [Burkholderiaceae bacterium]
MSHPLNAVQHEAVRYLDGPCLVLAGAGSGKTRVITQKIAYLLKECGYSARHVVALTFTNKAALEMQERVHKQVSADLTKGLMISTFHSLGVRMLREEALHIGLKPQFSILDSQDAIAIIQDIVATTDKGRLRNIQQTISLWKNQLVSADAAARLVKTENEREAATVFASYSATLTAYQAVDFDDLIMLPALLLRTNDVVREKWQNRVRYLLVDEYQDTNVCQYELVRQLTGARAMFTAVGDDDQAIYAWRGATIENLAKLQTDYDSLRLIKLEQNYRSSQTILAAANQVIGHNPKAFDKKLWSEHGTGEAISVTAFDDDAQESQSVAMRISAARFEKQSHWRDFAILYRGNHQARIFEQTLRQLNIPYTLSGGQSFFDKTEVRDVMSYLRLIANDNDDPAFIRAVTTPRRGVGQSTLHALGTYAGGRQISLMAATFEEGVSVHIPDRQLEPLRTFATYIQRLQWRAEHEKGEQAGLLLDDLLKTIGYEAYLFDANDERAAQARWQNVLDLRDWLKKKATDMSLLDLVQHIALVTMLERNEDETPDAVKLSTLHAAKGLEFPHVFLVGVEEGLLPHQGREEDESLDLDVAAQQKIQRIEEERRLMYVGITRAQRSLHLTWCKKRKRAREELVREVSRFVKEMGLNEPNIEVDTHATLSPKDRLGMLKALLQPKK